MRCPVELPKYRTQTSKTFANPDVTLTSEVYLSPIHYKKGGKWVDIDNTIIPSTYGSSVENKANKFKGRFPESSLNEATDSLFTYTIDGKIIVLRRSKPQENLYKLGFPI